MLKASLRDWAIRLYVLTAKLGLLSDVAGGTGRRCPASSDNERRWNLAPLSSAAQCRLD